MNNKKIMSSVFEKISNGKEVNLESQKVELGIVDDFEKEFEKANKEDISIGNTLISALSKAESKYKGQINQYEKAIKIGDKAIETAKDLGVDLPNTVKNKILSSKEGIKEARTLINKISQLYNLF